MIDEVPVQIRMLAKKKESVSDSFFVAKKQNILAAPLLLIPMG